MKRVAVIQDLSCLGKCSLTVALPVLAAMGVEGVPLPTALLSTHTGFPDPTRLDLSGQMLPMARHWAAQGAVFDGVYVGYLNSPEQVDLAGQAMELLAGADALRFVDPAMADHGRLYSGLSPAFPAAMAKLCARADVISPNLTEACLLSGLPYREDFSLPALEELLRAVAAPGARLVLLTGAPLGGGGTGVLGYHREEDVFFSHPTPRLPGRYHGAGDLFAAVCVGALLLGRNPPSAAALAADFTLTAIRATSPDPEENRFGLAFETALPALIRRVTAL